MQSSGADPSPLKRSAAYYFDDGDIVVRAEATLFRFHAFHLQRESTHFDNVIRARVEGGAAGLQAGRGFGEDDPLILNDVKGDDFEGLLWVLYESAYVWPGTVDTSVTAKWESGLRVAAKYNMREIAKVACYALGRTGMLGDARKIALCAKHGMDKYWVLGELRRVLSRVEPLSPAEGEELGPALTATLAAAREELRLEDIRHGTPCTPTPLCTRCREYFAKCSGGIHVCVGFSLHSYLCPRAGREPWPQDKFLREIVLVAPYGMSERWRQRADSHHYGLSSGSSYTIVPPRICASPDTWPHAGGDLYLQIEGNVYYVHSYHLKRASPVFAQMFHLPPNGTVLEGTSASHPVTLDVKAYDFESLLWFFYDYPYQWSYVPDGHLIPKWKAILAMADMFDMEDVCRVASYELDYHGGLTDIAKISRCVRHRLSLDWALGALVRVCARPEAITREEARDLGWEMTALVAAAREQGRNQGVREHALQADGLTETLSDIVRDNIIHVWK